MLNIVDDQPTLAHDWLPEMAAMLGAPAPRHVPAWLARPLVGGWGVAYMTGLAGASNARARQQLELEAYLQRLARGPVRRSRRQDGMKMRAIAIALPGFYADAGDASNPSVVVQQRSRS